MTGKNNSNYRLLKGQGEWKTKRKEDTDVNRRYEVGYWRGHNVLPEGYKNKKNHNLTILTIFVSRTRTNDLLMREGEGVSGDDG